MSESPNDYGESPNSSHNYNKYKRNQSNSGESPNDQGESPSNTPYKRKY